MDTAVCIFKARVSNCVGEKTERGRDIETSEAEEEERAIIVYEHTFEGSLPSLSKHPGSTFERTTAMLQ